MLGFHIAIFVPGWYVLVRSLCKAGLAEYTIAALRPFFLSVASIAPAFWLADQLDGAVLRLGLGVLVAAPLYVLVNYKSNREWFNAMRELARISG